MEIRGDGRSRKERGREAAAGENGEGVGGSARALPRGCNPSGDLSASDGCASSGWRDGGPMEGTALTDLSAVTVGPRHREVGG